MNRFSPFILLFSFLIAFSSGASAESPFERAGSRLIAAQSFSADFSVTSKDAKGRVKHQFGRLKLLKPNFVRLDIWTVLEKDQWSVPRTGLPHEIRASDGKFYWRILPDGTFTKTEANLQTVDDLDDFLPIAGFFDSWKLYLPKPAPRLIPAGTILCDGAPCKLFTMPAPKGQAKGATGQIAFGRDHIIRLLKSNAGPSSEIVLRNVKVDAGVREADFKFKRPTFAKVWKKDSPPETASGLPVPEETPVLANGTVAPNFTVLTAAGRHVKLSDYKGKVVVLDFWASWCGPCMASMPHTNAAARKFKKNGVVFLAVNMLDEKANYDSWLPKGQKYDSLIFAIDSAHEIGQDIGTVQYKVSGLPTQFVIGKDGKIVESFVGYGRPDTVLENTIKSALAK